MIWHQLLLILVSFQQVLILNKGRQEKHCICLEWQLSVWGKLWQSGLTHRKSPFFIPVSVLVSTGRCLSPRQYQQVLTILMWRSRSRLSTIGKTIFLGNITYTDKIDLSPVSVHREAFFQPNFGCSWCDFFSYWSQYCCSGRTFLARPSLDKSDFAEHLDGEAGNALGSCNASLQGSQEGKSETCLWKLCFLFIPCGTVWGWHRVQAGAVTDRDSESSGGKTYENTRQKPEKNSHTHVYICK